VFEDDALKLLAHQAFKENTGARGLVSVVEDALLPFEERLPSCAVTRLVVNRPVITDPAGTLKDLLSDAPEKDWESLYQKAVETEIQYLTDYIRDNAASLTAAHGMDLTPVRCRMTAQYFRTQILEINDALKKIRHAYDGVKEIEREISRNMNLTVFLEEDAVDFLMIQFIEHKVSSDDILSNLYNAFYDGLNLIREKTGRNRFFLTRADLLDSEAYLNDLIRKEIK